MRLKSYSEKTMGQDPLPAGLLCAVSRKVVTEELGPVP